MKKLFSYKRLEISIVKGFVFGIGLDREYVLFIGPFMFELLPPVTGKKQVRRNEI